MMNEETKLKVQAYLDDELGPDEAAEVAALLGRDPQARALYEELTLTKTMLASNELAINLVVGREFYWRQIERQITDQTAVQPGSSRVPGLFELWWRWLAPAVGVAVCLTVILLSRQTGEHATRQAVLPQLEGGTADASFISFYSPAVGMSVVWVDTDAADTDTN